MFCIGILGTAHIHTREFLELLGSRPDVRVGSVWPSPGTQLNLPESLGAVEIAASAESVAEQPEVDAVVILDQTLKHEDLIRLVVAAEKHFFVEKPVVIDPSSVGDVGATIREKELLFQTGFFLRYDPLLKRLPKDWRRLEITFTHSGMAEGWFSTDYNWMTDPSLAGFGGFGDLGIHCVDLALAITREMPIEFDSNILRNADGLDLAGDASLRFSEERSVIFTCGWEGDPVMSISFDGNPQMEITARPIDALAAFLDSLHGESRALVRFDEALLASQLISALLAGEAQATG